MGLTVMD